MMTIPGEIIIALCWTIIHSIWQFGLIAIACKVLLSIISGSTSRMKYNLLLVGLILGMVLFCTTFFIEYQSFGNVEIASTVEIANDEISPLENNYFNYGERSSSMPVLPNSGGIMSSIFDAVNQYSKWIVIAWLLGMLLFTIRFMNAYFFLNNLREIGVGTNEKWQAKVNDLKQRLGIQKQVQFLLSQIADQPMTFGFIKPVILIPASLITQLNPEQLELIILHELSHVRRNDYLINLFQSIMEIIFFYHPAIWWLSNQIRQIREEACDDKVVSCGKDPLQYAQTLLKTKKYIFNNSKTRLAMNATNSNPNHFTQRIYRIMGKENQLKSHTPMSKPMLVMTVLLCVFVLSACTSLAVGTKKIASVSLDKMNVLYIGVDNPITLAVSNTDYKNLEIKCEGSGLEVTPVSEGKYKAIVYEPGNAVMTVKGKDFTQKMSFRVKRVPTPSPSLLSEEEFNHPETIEYANRGGKISAEDFKKSKGVISIIENFEFDAKCEIKGYEITRVPEKQDPMRVALSTKLIDDSRSTRPRRLMNAAESGDTYYFDNIMCQCPGDSANRKMSPMVWSIW